jgi:hypothetical protein
MKKHFLCSVSFTALLRVAIMQTAYGKKHGLLGEDNVRTAE